jgi:predicted  nucleic acid-binding Zn-ribbon protein
VTVEVPQWLGVRRSEVKAEEAALARIQQHLEDLRTRLQLLASQLEATEPDRIRVIGTALVAEGRYRERLKAEWQEVHERVKQAEAALARQQEKVARARRALEVAEDVVEEQGRAIRQAGEKRQEQQINDWAAGRGPR